MENNTNFKKCLKRLEKHSTSEILKRIDGYEIDTVREFLEYLGSPDKSLDAVFHIGGTSGKGSTAHFISALLTGHNVKNGLFTSPHIKTVCERICIDRNMISEGDFSRIVNFVIDKAERFSKTKVKRQLTYFEILLASALVFFKEQNVKVGVVEVGLGGTLDPTNVLDGDIVVLTNIGLDHVNILGDTIEKIAKDKVGIIKRNSICVSGFEQSSVVSILRERVGQEKAGLLLLGKEFTAYDLVLKMLGKHQVENASLALEAVREYFNQKKHDFDEEKVGRILHNVKVPGRIEIKQKNPLIIWDAAHNEDKIEALVSTLLLNTTQNINMLFAFKRGQNFRKLIPHFSKINKRVKRVILTNYKITQDVVLESEPVQNFIQDLRETLPDADIAYESDPIKAYSELKQGLKPEDMLLVTGSFYLLSVISKRAD